MRLTSLAVLAAFASPAGAATLDLTAAASNSHVLAGGDGRLSVEVELVATAAQAGNRLPMNLALVIDRSGSMMGDKIEHTRRAAEEFIGRLGESDTLSIISYSDDVRVDLGAGRVTEAFRKRALAAVRGMRASGSTNLSGGLFRGQEEVGRRMATGQVNRVILMSDGLANRGLTDTRQIAIAAQRAAQRGITCTTMGVGTDYNEDLMTAVADHGGGNYYFIAQPGAIAGVLSTEIDKMFATVAQGTSVVVRLDDGTDLVSVLGYTYTRRGSDVVIPLAEVFAGQRRSVLLELDVATVRAGSFPVATVELQYTDILGGGEPARTSTRLDVTVTRDLGVIEEGRNRRVEERVEELRAAQVMTRAADLVRDGKRTEAQQVVREEAVRLKARAAALGGSGRVQTQAEAVEKLEYEFNDDAAAPATIKATKAKAYELSK